MIIKVWGFEMLKTGFVSLIFGLIGAVIFTSAHNHFYDQSYGVVRVEQILADQIQSFANSGIPAEDAAAQAERFAKTLESTIEQYSQDHNVILFVSKAVVSRSNVPDYTDIIQAQVKGNLL